MKILNIVFLVISLNVGLTQHPNVMVGGYLGGNDPNEPSIAVNPANTNEIVAGANIDNYYYSSDAGSTWTHGDLTSIYGVWGDPCVVADSEGNFYFFHLSDPLGDKWVDRIVCQKLEQIGGDWSSGTFTGLNGTKIQDKEWATVDLQNNFIYVTWTQFDAYGSDDPDCYSNIMFSRSTDGGQTWSQAIQINEVSGNCLDDDDTAEGATPAVGPQGEIYVSWASPEGIVFDKSTDGGNTWLDHDIFVSDNPGGWAFPDIPGVYRAGGMPVTACDVSNGPFHGTIYINWSDERNGTNDHDIWLSKSIDGGETWSAPKRVNNDSPGNMQFFSWMTIDQTTGYLYFVFYDRRNYNNNQTDVYLAVSKNGGETFRNFKISESPFTPSKGRFMGDYNNISAVNGIIRPIWTRMDSGLTSIWTALINSELILEVADTPSSPYPSEFEIISIYPNPFNPITTVEYSLASSSPVIINIYDILGRKVDTIFYQHMDAGFHTLQWNASRIPSGIYFIQMLAGDFRQTRKVIVLR